MTNSIAEKKWRKFRYRARLFRHIPFIEFVLAGGSMAIGNPHENSDFDVIVAVKNGRIFTARAFAVFVFDAFGWRRRAAHNKDAKPESVSDKICLSHFVTERSYRLSPPHNEYGHKLYGSLTPLWGEAVKIHHFFDANDWLTKRRKWQPDEKYIPEGPSYFKKFAESVLSGKFGDWLEKIVKAVQIWRIKRGLSGISNKNPRIIYTDHELEFHPDPK